VVFSSLIFLYAFLPACLACYYLGGSLMWRNRVLIAFSLLFYAWGEPIWVTLLLVSSFVDYCNGIWVERTRGLSRLPIVVSVSINLGVLAAFKYSGFLASNVNHLFGATIPVNTYQLPIGLSFYTFQSISYVVDVYRGEIPAQRSFPKFLLFLSLFHHLVAGPIVRY